METIENGKLIGVQIAVENGYIENVLEAFPAEVRTLWSTKIELFGAAEGARGRDG